MAIGNTPLGRMGIEINLDDTKLRQSTTNLKAVMKSVDAEFKANMSSIKRTGSEMDILGQRTQGLNKKYEVQKKVVNSLEEAYEKARIEAEKQGASQQQIRAMESKRAQLNKEIASLNDLESALEQAQKEQEEMMANNKRMESSFAKLDGKMRDSADKFKDFGGKLTGIGKQMSVAITAPIVGLGVGAVRAAADYDAASSQFEQVFGKMEKDATKSLEKISKETGLLPNSLKGSYTQIAAFAKTTGADTATALDITSRATLAAADSAAFYDRSIEEVTESLQSYLKGNFANDAALGISSTETTRNAKANDLYGKSFKDLNEEQKQLTLLAMVEDGNKLSGALGQAARESDQLGTQTGNLKTAFKDFLAEIGKPILPIAVQALKSLSSVLKTGVEQFKNMSKFGKGMVLAFGGIIAILPPILIGIGMIATGLGSIMALGAPMVLTIGGVVAGLAILAIGLTTAYKRSETFRNALHKVADVLGKAFKGMADYVGKAFGSIAKMLGSFWNENGKMIIQATQNVISVLRPILDVLGKLFSVTFKVAFVVVKTIVVGTFNAIVGVIKGAINIILGVVQVFSALFTGNWKKLFEGLGRILKGAVQVIWNLIQLSFFGRILKAGKTFAISFTKIFPALWNGIKKIFTGSLNAIFNFVKNIWNSLHKVSNTSLSSTRQLISRILTAIKNVFVNIFNAIWNKTKSIFDSIRKFAPNAITKTKDGVLNGLQAMSRGLGRLMDSMKKKVSDVFTNMVNGAKALPKRLGDGIRNGASKAVDGVKSLGNAMVGKLGAVVNGTIGGINTVTGKLGIGKKVKEWNVPKFSTGTKNGALANSGLITVGDFGVGNGTGRRELVRFPNGQMKLFNQETTFYAPQGTEVYSNKQTEEMLNPLKFSTGTGVGGFWGNIGKTVVNGFGDLMDFITEPVKFAKDMMNKVMQKTGFDGLSNFALDMAKGGFNQVKSAVVDFLKGAFDEVGSAGDGSSFMSYPITTPYSPNARPAGYPFNAHHYGVDFATPQLTPINAPTSGVLSTVFDTRGGQTAILRMANGWQQFFMHMERVRKSGAIKAGSYLGHTGGAVGLRNSGQWSTGAHLHYQVNQGSPSWNTGTVNPLQFLSKQGVKASSGKGGKWTPTVQRALQLAGLPNNPAYVNAWLKQIQTESGGNPSIIGGDDGLRDGRATGLVQVKPPTFNAFKLAGHGNIFNALDNLIAGMRYAKARYGSSMLSVIGHGHGYKTGGLVFGKQLAWLDEEGYGEAVIPFNPSRREDAMKLLAYTAMKIMPKEKGGQGYRPNSLPNISNNDSSGNDMLKLLLQMVKNQDAQIEELKEQTRILQQDRFTELNVDGRKIADATHKYHQDIDARRAQFRPS